LKLSTKNEPNLENWKAFLGRLKNPTNEVNIALVGKYVELPDAYKSISEGFIHAGAANETKVKVKYFAAESMNDENVAEKLKNIDGVLVAPGFGERGLDGKLSTIKYVRENKIPFFGICLGMQCSVIEFGRNVLGLKDANSFEMNENTEHPVINLMEEQKNIKNMGGMMRLGADVCEIKRGTKAYAIYGKTKITQRHGHRYEFNNDYLEQFEKAGMIASGVNPDTGLVDIVELKDHPFFVAGQFHPESKSTVANPHPLFVSIVAAALANKIALKK